jgi:hypothetical protein
MCFVVCRLCDTRLRGAAVSTGARRTRLLAYLCLPSACYLLNITCKRRRNAARTAMATKSRMSSIQKFECAHELLSVTTNITAGKRHISQQCFVPGFHLQLWIPWFGNQPCGNGQNCGDFRFAGRSKMLPFDQPVPALPSWRCATVKHTSQ